MPETPSCTVNKAVIFIAEPSVDSDNFPLDTNLDKMITSMLKSLNENTKPLKVEPSGPIVSEPAPVSNANAMISANSAESVVIAPEVAITPNTPDMSVLSALPMTSELSIPTPTTTVVEGFRNNLKKTTKEYFLSGDEMWGVIVGSVILLFIIATIFVYLKFFKKN